MRWLLALVAVGCGGAESLPTEQTMYELTFECVDQCTVDGRVLRPSLASYTHMGFRPAADENRPALVAYWGGMDVMRIEAQDPERFALVDGCLPLGHENDDFMPYDLCPDGDGAVTAELLYDWTDDDGMTGVETWRMRGVAPAAQQFPPAFNEYMVDEPDDRCPPGGLDDEGAPVLDDNGQPCPRN